MSAPSCSCGDPAHHAADCLRLQLDALRADLARVTEERDGLATRLRERDTPIDTPEASVWGLMESQLRNLADETTDGGAWDALHDLGESFHLARIAHAQVRADLAREKARAEQARFAALSDAWRTGDNAVVLEAVRLFVAAKDGDLAAAKNAELIALRASVDAHKARADTLAADEQVWIAKYHETGDQLDAQTERADRAEAEVEHYKEREAHYSKALQVADGGQYRNDWDGAIASVLADRDRLKAEVERYHGLYVQAVNGRREMRAALREERSVGKLVIESRKAGGEEMLDRMTAIMAENDRLKAEVENRLTERKHETERAEAAEHNARNLVHENTDLRVEIVSLKAEVGRLTKEAEALRAEARDDEMAGGIVAEIGEFLRHQVCEHVDGAKSHEHTPPMMYREWILCVLGHQAKKVAYLRAINAKLVEAARPFAAYYHPHLDRLDGRLVSRRVMPDEDEARCSRGEEIGVTAADCRAAKAALAAAGVEP